MDFSLIVYLHVIADSDFKLKFVDAILYAFLNLIFPKYFAVFQAILPWLLLA